MIVSLNRLLRPRSIAIIGASNDPERIGGRPIQSLVAGGYAGANYPINPSRTEVQGLKAYADNRDVPGDVDAVIMAIPQDKVIESIAACADRGVGAAVIFMAGFGEQGKSGKSDQRRLFEIA